MPTEEQILKALEVVIDPELRKSIVELGMVRSIEQTDDGKVAVVVSLTTAGCPIRSHFEDAVAEAVGPLDGVTGVSVSFDVLSDTEKGELQRKLGRGSLPEGALAQVSNVVCIGSGKGGVGKSTITANLAAALAADGKRVGVLDADVWGYSIPRMFNVKGRPPVSPERKIVPLESGGVKIMSIGFFVEEDAAVVWRGPMLHKALTQFLEDVEWGELDFLLVDLPPGTGDVSMTLAQLLPQAQFVIVTTPGLIPEQEVQLHLFSPWNGPKNNAVSSLMDKLNTHYGSGTIRMASEGYKKHWAMKRENVSPNYTTAWDDILRVG